MDYRSRIYENYASGFQDVAGEFNPAEARRAGKVWHYYLRDWIADAKDAAILDVACGNGKLLHFLMELGYTNCSGVDISPEQVRMARQIHTNVHEANALDYLESHPEAYDLIVGLDIIEHFTKDEALRFLDGCLAALKPGGRLILQTPNPESPFGGVHRYNDLTHEICLNTNAMQRILRMCGFRDIQFREASPVPWGYSIKSTLRYVAWRVLRVLMKVFNLVETGYAGSPVFTRIYLTTALKSQAK